MLLLITLWRKNLRLPLSTIIITIAITVSHLQMTLRCKDKFSHLLQKLKFME
jgi:hypothetical protein